MAAFTAADGSVGLVKTDALLYLDRLHTRPGSQVSEVVEVRGGTRVNQIISFIRVPPGHPQFSKVGLGVRRVMIFRRLFWEKMMETRVEAMSDAELDREMEPDLFAGGAGMNMLSRKAKEQIVADQRTAAKTLAADRERVRHHCTSD